ncbi:MAG: HAD-IA family hydrolase [Flavobacteriia bacterium]|nr:HAD-IA family hydrolase [Flavobacteriia bacterium]
MEEEIEAIIFDLGGVIINLDYSLTTKAFQDLGLKNFEEIYAQANQSTLFDDFETGKISAQHFVNLLLPYLPIGISANKVVHAWNAMILDFPVERLELLLELKQKRKLILLSNTNEIHLQAVNRSLSKVTDKPLSYFFDEIYLSHEIGMRKPTTAIFEYVCEEQNLNVNRTLFIDDTIRHVEGARLTGLKGYHLKCNETILELNLGNL